MDCPLPLRRFGDTTRPTLHSYYDVCPESPDGSRVLITIFETETVPGPARVAMQDIGSGAITMIGEPSSAIGHVGRFAVWLSDDRIAYRVGGEEDGRYRIRDLASGDEVQRDGALRQWDVVHQRGLVQTRGRDNPHGFLQGCELVDADGQTLRAFDVADCFAVCPADAFPDGKPVATDELNIMNLKFSPDGGRFSVVLTDEKFRRSVLGSTASRPAFKVLIGFDVVGGEAFWIGPFTHHPIWRPDGDGMVAFMVDEPTEGSPGSVGSSIVSRSQRLEAIGLDGSRRTLVEGIAGNHASIAPDGTWAAIDVPVDSWRACEIQRVPLDGGDRQTLMTFPHNRWAHDKGHHPHPVFSRDGRAIYVNAQDGGACGLYRVEVG